eukprot:13311998-Alexandrium_andersonii.AAC.1
MQAGGSRAGPAAAAPPAARNTSGELLIEEDERALGEVPVGARRRQRRAAEAPGAAPKDKGGASV